MSYVRTHTATAPEPHAETVEQLVGRIKRAAASIPGGDVEAEVEEISRSRAGHLWLTLAGSEDARVKAVIWRRDAERIERPLPVPLAKGQQVLARYDRVEFYGPHGQLRVIVSAVTPVGAGQLLARRQRDLEQLQREGLTERTRLLPLFPRTIGLIAGDGSDALNDVVTGIRQRFPAADILFVPAAVQGPRASGQLIRAVLTLDARREVEVIAIARGGGSVSDLVAFDDLELCQIVANTNTPTVAAIGHTTNRPNCYAVADAHANVPHEVADVIFSRSATDVLRTLDRAVQTIEGGIEQVREHASELDDLARRRRRSAGLSERRAELTAAGSKLTAQAEAFYRARYVELDSAREAIHEARRSAPGPESLDSAREAIHAACRGVPRPAALDRPAAVIAAAIRSARREAEAEQRALDKTLVRALAAARRVLADDSERIERLDAGRARAGVHRLEHEFRARLERKAAELRAHDPSERGFALVRDTEGQIIDSIGDLAVESEFELEMHDGRARGRVLDVHHEEGEPDD